MFFFEILARMYIRRTTIKSRKNGEQYYTYRLVESVRTAKSVRQRTLLNLGSNFSCPRDSWPDLAKRIAEIISAQNPLFPPDSDLEDAAQRYAALIIQSTNRADGINGDSTVCSDYRNVDINTLEFMRPRSIGIEHVAYEALRKLQLDKKLQELGLNKHQLFAAIGTVIGRIIEPGSELATHYWLQHHTGLGELVGYDYENMKLTRMYQISDVLLKHKQALEQHLYERQRSIFQFKETITLYDLTNTYFEGSGKYNDLAERGHSKEKRTDCPLVTLGLVLDSSGFPIRSEVFAGNASEPQTLAEMIKGLTGSPLRPAESTGPKQLFKKGKPTVVMDAGIATEDNINWLKENQHAYLVVSRKHHREFSEKDAAVVKMDKDCTVKAYKKINDETGEVELYCHSTRREDKENAIYNRFATRFEEALDKLDAGLHKKGCVKKYDKVLVSLGRLKQKYSRAAKNYQITVKKDQKTENAVQIIRKKKQAPNSKDSHPGVYCLRTNQDTWDETTLWRTYTMLTDLEAVFRSLKSELGLRPVFHQKTKRVSGHLFITLLAYHLIHTIRCQLKMKNIHSSWSNLRKHLKGQDRITVSMNCQNGEAVHIRKSTRPEPRQQIIYDALGLAHYPGRTIKKVVAA
ncbi:MAG: IS1634 family transposase [Deltaproteobacteria bacterium]|nr:MAG: IS1634 family transposase [Deltaproteobacteria bacterium]